MKTIILLSLLSLPSFAGHTIGQMFAAGERQKSVCTLSATGNPEYPLHVKMEFFFEGDPAGTRQGSISNDYNLISMSRELRNAPYTEVFNPQEKGQYLISAAHQDHEGIDVFTPVFGTGYRTIDSSSPLRDDFVQTIEALCLTLK